ncbi:MAG: hypothetical protein AAGN46_02920 [Acidobacteriota bacterium]
MGVFYNSLCLRGDRSAPARAAVERWLFARGFRPSEEPNLFDLDAPSERSVFVLSNEHWTILLYSHFDEERRLIRELQAADLGPLLYLWVYDSDVWGYDLFEDDRFTASFASDPATYFSFADDVPFGERPSARPAELCRRLELPAERASEIGRVERRRTAFSEEACAALARLLGCGPAVNSYDELELRALAAADGVLDGWSLRHLVYFDPRAAGVGDERAECPPFDLHSLEIEGAPADRRHFGKSTAQIELSPDLLRELERMRRRARWTLRLLAPVSAAARAWSRLRGGREAPVSGAVDRMPVALPPPAPAVERILEHPRHGVRIEVPNGVEVETVSGRPSSVFAFRIDGLFVVVNARRRRSIRDVLRRPSRATVARDERGWAGDLPLRRVVFALPTRAGGDAPPSFLGYDVVQTFRCLFVFYTRWSGELSDETWERLGQLAASLRLTPDGPPRRAERAGMPA